MFPGCELPARHCGKGKEGETENLQTLLLNIVIASVYKSVSKTAAEPTPADEPDKNKQMALVLTSRGITYRFVSFSAPQLRSQ